MKQSQLEMFNINIQNLLLKTDMYFPSVWWHLSLAQENLYIYWTCHKLVLFCANAASLWCQGGNYMFAAEGV